MIDRELLTTHTARLAKRLREISETLRSRGEREAASILGIAEAVERLANDSEITADDTARN